MSETDRPDDVLLAIREFLREDSLDSIRVDLRRIYYGLGDSLSSLEAGIYLSEEDRGHFCFYSDDLPALAAVASKIAEAALALRNACLMVIADAAPDAPAEAQPTWSDPDIDFMEGRR